MRAPSRSYHEYHTSLDDKSLISFPGMVEAVDACEAICGALEANRRWLNLQPYGEPQLGRRGLYRSLGGLQTIGQSQLAMLWVLNCSDGRNSLLDIAERADLPFRDLQAIAEILVSKGLLEAVEPQTP